MNWKNNEAGTNTFWRKGVYTIVIRVEPCSRTMYTMCNMLTSCHVQGEHVCMASDYHRRHLVHSSKTRANLYYISVIVLITVEAFTWRWREVVLSQLCSIETPSQKYACEMYRIYILDPDFCNNERHRATPPSNRFAMWTSIVQMVECSLSFKH